MRPLRESPKVGWKAVLDRVRMADHQPVWVATSVLDPEEIGLYYSAQSSVVSRAQTRGPERRTLVAASAG